eukprot:scaffold636_cov252-Pinguiococcus_pyrenoidosus.AAC.8
MLAAAVAQLSVLLWDPSASLRQSCAHAASGTSEQLFEAFGWRWRMRGRVCPRRLCVSHTLFPLDGRSKPMLPCRPRQGWQHRRTPLPRCRAGPQVAGAREAVLVVARRCVRR